MSEIHEKSVEASHGASADGPLTPDLSPHTLPLRRPSLALSLASLGVLLPLFVVTVAILIANVAVVIYYAVQYGPMILIYWVFGFIGLHAVLRSLRAFADRLSTRTLTLIFAVPGAGAAVVQFLLDYPQLLRLLPF